MDITPGIWRYPQWIDQGDGIWHFLQHFDLVGEAYTLVDGFKWHCKTSDWRSTNALSIEQAMAECEASFWKDAWEELRKQVLG